MTTILVRCLAVAVAGWHCAGALAQATNRITEPSATPATRWQAEAERLDLVFRDRLLGATAPRAAWVAGVLEGTDTAVQVAYFAQARREAPAEKLYLASLATACNEPVRPRPADCESIDRLADWATRDADNGVPSLLLAERARLRNNGPAMIAFLQEAAARPRFDDYWSRGAFAIWEEVRALPVTAEPAAKAELAASYGAAHASQAARAMEALCRDPLKFGDEARAACAAAGAAVAQRGASWALRIAGARMAERSTPVPAPGTGRPIADLQLRAFACAEAGDPIAAALQSPDSAVRARAVAQVEARLKLEADAGEVAACARGAKR